MFDDFTEPLNQHWTQTCIGGGTLQFAHSMLRMAFESAIKGQYTDAQIFSARGDILMLPEAIWFFYASPPSNMALVPGIPGWGWKAQVVHSMRPGALAATIPLAATTVLGLLTRETRPAARWMQRLTGAYEALLTVEMTNWHTYTLEWLHSEAAFWVDDKLVLRAPQPPTRPLGFVAWLDNQYAIATPRGVLRFGTVASGPQWFELDSVNVEPK